MATGSPFFSPVFLFCDPNGVPYAGGSLAFYAAGTNTPQTVYADIALTTPLTNPVVLNSGGFVPQIFLQDLEYRVVLSDVNSIQIWTADPVFSGGQFTTTVVVTGAGSIGFQAANTAANGQVWSLLSNPDGSFSIEDVTTGQTPFGITAAGVVYQTNGTNVVEGGNVGDIFTNTSTLGQAWGWASLNTGTFQVFNFTLDIGSMLFESAGNGAMPFDMLFQSTVEVDGLTTLSGGVNIETDPLTVTSLATFTNAATFEANLASTSTAGFQGPVSFTSTTIPASVNVGNAGFEATSTGASGRSWGWLSGANGNFEVYDFTAAAIRAYFNPAGALTVSGAATIVGELSLLAPVQLVIYLVASLPAATGLAIGCVAFATNGRNTGEAASAGTGCMVQVQSKASVLTWCAVWSGVQVTA